MPRITAKACDCGCKMKRIYSRSDGGKGWDPVGWMCTCGCGCVSLDAGEWQLTECCSKKEVVDG